MRFVDRPALFADLYELTMLQGFYLQGIHERRAGFDYFFRKLPFGGGYVVFAGLQDLLDTLEGLSFGQEEIDFLRERGFRAEFLNWLGEFRFQGSILAAREGEVVFPGEPIVRVTGRLAEVQLIETLLLNILNFESLIATKAARMRWAAGPERTLLDFGLRRAQGLGGLHATRAAMIGGFNGTSNVHAAQTYGLPAFGTMAHSWIQSFESELEAFRAFTSFYPDTSVLLVDTYSTLGSGVPNAITVAKELEAKGHRLRGIRLDSGDLAYFSRKARRMLDDAGLGYVRITASNQLDEYLIQSLLLQKAPIDSFGVGTRLVTGVPDAALDGVYKQCMIGGRATLKVSENVEKVTLPGLKRVWRFIDSEGFFAADGIGLDAAGLEAGLGGAGGAGGGATGATLTTPPSRIQHPFLPRKQSETGAFLAEDLLVPAMESGRSLIHEHDLGRIAEFSASRRLRLAPEHLRFDNPHVYKVGISQELAALRDELMKG